MGKQKELVKKDRWAYMERERSLSFKKFPFSKEPVHICKKSAQDMLDVHICTLETVVGRELEWLLISCFKR